MSESPHSSKTRHKSPKPCNPPPKQFSVIFRKKSASKPNENKEKKCKNNECKPGCQIPQPKRPKTPKSPKVILRGLIKGKRDSSCKAGCKIGTQDGKSKPATVVMSSRTYPPPGTESEVGFCACCRGVCLPRNKKQHKHSTFHHEMHKKPLTKDKATQYDPKLSKGKKKKEAHVVHKVVHADVHRADDPPTPKGIQKHHPIEKHELLHLNKTKTPKKSKNHSTNQSENDEERQKNLVLIITKLGKKGFMCSALKLDSQGKSKSNKSL